MAAEDRRSLDDALIGRTIAGKFTIESRIGGGGMGSVYRARQAGLDKIVAIKLLHRELLAEPTFASRFKREATSASRIDHPSSLRVLDFGEEPDGLLFIAMEFLEGKTLFKVLREEAPLAPSRIVDLSRQILAALAAAHDLGIVHRDLKPENVIVLPGKDDDGGASEHVKVCDFGIAKLQTEADVEEKLTMEGSIVGTPEYLSPEQARGGQIDARSDLYSMGVILFEMLTGQPPFRGDTPLAIVLKHLDAPPPLPSSITPTADPKLEAVCLKALSKAPADRYSSAREMRASLFTDTPDALAPPAPSRTSNILFMAETPPPVSSTQDPVHLMSKRSSALGSGQRLRLSEYSEPAASGSSRALIAVVAIALLGGGGGAFMLRKRASLQSGHAIAAAHEGPMVLPSSTAPETSAPTDPSPSASAAMPLGSAAGAFPPSELPGAPQPATRHRRRKVATTGSGTATVKGSAPVEPGAPGIETEFDDEPATPANPASPAAPAAPAPVSAPGTGAGGAVKVRIASLHTTNISDGAVRNALPTGTLSACYHGAPGSHASVTVHIALGKSETTASSEISQASFASLGACVVEAAKRISLVGVPAGGATADVQVDFDAP
jgi:serine/threonine-protein kinase